VRRPHDALNDWTRSSRPASRAARDPDRGARRPPTRRTSWPTTPNYLIHWSARLGPGSHSLTTTVGPWPATGASSSLTPTSDALARRLRRQRGAGQRRLARRNTFPTRTLRMLPGEGHMSILSHRPYPPRRPQSRSLDCPGRRHQEPADNGAQIARPAHVLYRRLDGAASRPITVADLARLGGAREPADERLAVDRNRADNAPARCTARVPHHSRHPSDDCGRSGVVSTAPGVPPLR
jgi:hypothetical protein